MDNLFPILAIETSDKLCSVALLIDAQYYSEININGKHIHSEKLIPMIHELLTFSNCDISCVNSIAISEGPGSFTGLRIGMAAAKGLAQGANKPLIPVPTFDALAQKICKYINDEQKFALIKRASSNEVYFVKYKKTKLGFEVDQSLSLLEYSSISSFINRDDIVFDENISFAGQEVTNPSAVDIGKWAYKFGKDLVTFNYDLLEPRYLKEFKARNIS